VRIWTVHPKYLDPSGLTAAWREGLLARKVLEGRTRGYRHHPQLIRFRAHADPLAGIEWYLAAIYAEASARGYSFDAAKLGACASRRRIVETEGQLKHEWFHLLRKLEARAPHLHARFRGIEVPDAHPLFRLVPGDAQPWERAPVRSG
jgi:hypothetical protein